MRWIVIVSLALLPLLGSLRPTQALAQAAPPPVPDCTVAECAKRMVDIATKLIDENKALRNELNALEARQVDTDKEIKKLHSDADTAAESIRALTGTVSGGHGKILAAGIVRKSQLLSGSEGMTYDNISGRVTFPNPKGLKFVPLMASVSPTENYLTESCFTRSFGKDYFILWQGAQDTTGRNEAPRDCTFVVLGTD
ncbi:hypothetical protein ACU8MW_08120 [Rhizobium leguminosarum]